MPPPCQHDPPILPPAGRPYTTAYCRLCWLYHHDAVYRNRWGEPNCASRPGLALPVLRNLLWHIYPVRGSSWRWNADMVQRRLALFNGRRIVAVVTDDRTDPPAEVERALGGEIDELIQFQNQPELREVVTFEPLFRRVQSRHPAHATLYAHGKSVVRTGHPTCQRWAGILYEAHLDYWPVVESVLMKHALAGCFKKVGRGWPDHESRSTHHYSGSFAWFRNRDLFTKPDWTRIERFWSGVEPYWSLHFPVEQFGTIFFEGRVEQINLYDPGYFDGVVVPAWEKWKAEHAHLRSDHD
jgi:hypothetical protein